MKINKSEYYDQFVSIFSKQASQGNGPSKLTQLLNEKYNEKQKSMMVKNSFFDIKVEEKNSPINIDKDNFDELL